MLDRFSKKNAVLLHFGSYCTFTIFLLELVSYWLIPDSITIIIVEVEVNHILFWHLTNKPTFNNNNIKHFSFILWPVEDLKFQLSCGCHGDDGNLHNSDFGVNIFYVKKLLKEIEQVNDSRNFGSTCTYLELCDGFWFGFRHDLPKIFMLSDTQNNIDNNLIHISIIK